MPVGAIGNSFYSNPLPADPVPLIRSADLGKFIEKGATVVEFMNFGCPYCRNAMPLLDKVANEKAGKVRFAKMQMGDFGAQRLAVELGVQMLPAFALFHDGEFVGMFERQGADHLTEEFIRDNVNYGFEVAGVRP